MEEQIVMVVNDTSRAIEEIIKEIKEWKDNPGAQPFINPRETQLVITKLEEAQLWSYRMVKP